MRLLHAMREIIDILMGFLRVVFYDFKMINKQIGKRIREARELKGLSREQVARRVGVSQQQISRYESGENRVSAGKLFDISVVLDRSFSYFLSGE